MEPNDCRFHRVGSRSDWAAWRVCTPEGIAGAPLGEQASQPVEWAPRAGVLRLAGRSPRIPPSALGFPALHLGSPRAVAGELDFVYSIEADGRRISVQDIGRSGESRVWSAFDAPATAPDEPFAFRPTREMERRTVRGLAISASNHLVAIIERQLVVHDLASGGAGWTVAPSEDEVGSIDAVAVEPCGVHILDRQRRLLHHLAGGLPGGWLQAGTRVFRSCDGSRGVRMDVGPVAHPLPEGPDGPLDIVTLRALSPGMLLLVAATQDGVVLFRWQSGGVVGNTLSLEPPFGRQGPLVDLLVLVEDDADLDAGHARLIQVWRGERVAVTHGLSWNADRWWIDDPPTTHPLIGLGVRGLVSVGGVPYYDSSGRWLPLADRPSHAFERQGALRSRFDSGVRGCVWHRLMLDARIPNGAAVRIRTRCATDAEGLEQATWRGQPGFVERHRGELPYRTRLADVYELYLHGCAGRHIEIELTMESDGRSTPCIHELRIWFPRFSYLENYLPAVYRENADSARFLEGFLGNLEGLLTELEWRIATTDRQLDPRTASLDWLPWLAGWVGVSRLPPWSDYARRKFVQHAAAFHRSRGTPGGIQMAIRLALGERLPDEAFAPPLRYEASCPIRVLEPASVKLAPSVRRNPVDGGVSGLPIVYGRWLPAQGSEGLDARYGGPIARFPPFGPGDTDAVSGWRAFCREQLGFVPPDREQATPAWGRFVQRLGGAWGGAFEAEGDGGPPARLVSGGDWRAGEFAAWYVFAAVHWPRTLSAHRFSVALPNCLVERSTPAERAELLRAVRRVVDMQRPLHTVFDVNLYENALQMGRMRLGSASVTTSGARGLVRPAVVGQDVVGASVVGGPLRATSFRYRAGSLMPAPPNARGLRDE